MLTLLCPAAGVVFPTFFRTADMARAGRLRQVPKADATDDAVVAKKREADGGQSR
jgi:hypothetical protein